MDGARGTDEGTDMQLSANLHQIGSDIVDCYLVIEGTNVTIVDAGLPGQWSELLGELARIGRSLADVKALVLTHGDTDHVGFAARLHRESGVPVLVHEADAARARGEVKKPTSGWGPVKVRPFVRFLLYSGRRGGLRVPPVADVETIALGATLDVPGSPRVIGLPGHTPGSVAFHFPSVDAVFVGDALTTRNVLTGAEGPGPAPFTLDPAGALASIGALEAVAARWVLPGHGPAFDGGTVEAVRRYRQAATGVAASPPADRA
jgi:glyoxylase-like metal-dependent hydrolase (beta-lactamase superfamily II)